MGKYLAAVLLVALASPLAGCGGASAPKSLPGPITTTRAIDGLTGFTSADKNIGCIMDVSSVRCDIDQREWKPPATPADCELAFGQGIELATGGKPQFVCAGDTALRAGKVLPSGHAIKGGAITCVNQDGTFFCQSAKSGHGFRLSRESFVFY